MENKKLLGKRLLNYVVKLSEEGAIEESNYNCLQAFQKYEQAEFVCKELLRDLNNTLKFSTEYFEQSNTQQNQTNQQNEDKKLAKPPVSKAQRSLSPPRIASFTFVRREQWSLSPEPHEASQEQDSMFDLKTEEILHGLRRMILKRMEAVKKSPYFPS